MEIEYFTKAARLNREINNSRFEYRRLVSERKWLHETIDPYIALCSKDKELAPITDIEIIKRVLDYSIKLYYKKITFLQKQFDEL